MELISKLNSSTYDILQLVTSTYIVPPNNFEFNVMITEPIQIITKTSANSGPPSPCICIESGEACNTLNL